MEFQLFKIREDFYDGSKEYAIHINGKEKQFLLSENYEFVLSVKYSNNDIPSIYSLVELYEISFNEEIKNFILSKLLEGIFQYRILSLSAARYEKLLEYKQLKEIYKELKQNGIEKKLTLKEKIIYFLFGR